MIYLQTPTSYFQKSFMVLKTFQRKHKSIFKDAQFLGPLFSSFLTLIQDVYEACGETDIW